MNLYIYLYLRTFKAIYVKQATNWKLTKCMEFLKKIVNVKKKKNPFKGMEMLTLSLLIIFSRKS